MEQVVAVTRAAVRGLYLVAGLLQVRRWSVDSLVAGVLANLWGVSFLNYLTIRIYTQPFPFRLTTSPPLGQKDTSMTRVAPQMW